MATLPIISFFVTFYNQENYVARTLSSILSQTFENIEVVVVDDGSTDGTCEAIAQFKDPRIRFIRQDNEGPSSSANTAIKSAIGDYIAFVGGDDVCLPDRARNQLAIIQETGADVLFSKPELIDDQDVRLEPHVAPYFFDQNMQQFSANPLLVFFLRGNFLCASSALCRRELFTELGLFEYGLIQLQDFELWVRFAKAGKKFAVHDTPVVQYRLRGALGNLSAPDKQGRMLLEYRYLMRKFLDGMTIERLAEFSKSFGLPGQLNSSHEATVTKAMIYLSHPSREIREVGYHILMGMLDESEEARRVAQSYGIGCSTFFQLIQKDFA